jgi:hypothetical protein
MELAKVGLFEEPPVRFPVECLAGEYDQWDREEAMIIREQGEVQDPDEDPEALPPDLLQQTVQVLNSPALFFSHATDPLISGLFDTIFGYECDERDEEEDQGRFRRVVLEGFPKKGVTGFEEECGLGEVDVELPDIAG